MGFEVLILNSGEWVLAEELPAAPWHVLIYRQRGSPANELHVWLPRQDAPRSGDFAFKRYWSEAGVRWCVEVPTDVGRPRPSRGAPLQVRFSSPDGRVLWSEQRGGKGLGDLSDSDLARLLVKAHEGPFTR